MPAIGSPCLIRRALIAGSLALVAGAAHAQTLKAKAPVITMLGDSLTAGYGLKAGDAIPAQLQIELKRLGVDAAVRAAGVSGDTSADGLARANFSVKADSDLCIVALGGNDLLQGVDPKVTKANLDAILAKLKARHIPVLLVGLKAPPAMGAGYAHDFDAVVPDLAKARGVAVYPDLLGKVALDRSLNQGDGVHPNVQGVKIVVKGLAPQVVKVLKSKR
jgi:acyl-CoA thioesterase-1